MAAARKASWVQPPNHSLQHDRGPFWFSKTLCSAGAAAAERVVRRGRVAVSSSSVNVEEIAAQLREGVSHGRRLSELLVNLAVPHGLGTIELIKVLRLAFGISLAQAAPVGGWLPEGSGEISHERLDQYIGEAILASRGSSIAESSDAEPKVAPDCGGIK